MKKLLTLIVLAVAIGSLGSFTHRAISAPQLVRSTDTVVKERQENDFLRESKSDVYAYEFTEAGDYRFIVTDVEAPPFDFLNFCLDGPIAGLHFTDQRIINREVKNEFRCITGLAPNLESNEYIVRGIKPGTMVKAWPSNPSTILKRSGIHCTNNKFNCNIYGPQAEWENDGYKIKVLIMRAHH